METLLWLSIVGIVLFILGYSCGISFKNNTGDEDDRTTKPTKGDNSGHK